MQNHSFDETPSLGIYIHIPFCRHRCAYCDFNTYTSLSDMKDVYASALCQEIVQVAGTQTRAASTVFFGGGTPSLMRPTAIGKILDTTRRAFRLDAGAEITMEVNPGSVDEAYLAAVRAHGVNRLSFGVQSANASELALLERSHDFETVIQVVSQSRAAGFDNINLDLIYGLPDQSLASWEHSLKAALDLEPEHLSLYCLIIEPGTRMQRWLKTGQVPAPDPDLAADQYDLSGKMLAEAGFEHYEISNWSRPGKACRHNLIYWRNQEYLGFGAGAHGHAAGSRYSVVKQPRVFVRRMELGAPEHYPLSAAVAEHYRLSRSEQMADTVITQLRLLREGLDLPAFSAKFGQPFEQVYNGTVQQMMEWGLLRKSQDSLRLTQKGAFLSNQVFYRFI